MANKRLIDANALSEHIKSYAGMFTDELGFVVSLEAVLRGIEFVPTIEAVEVAHGRWIEKIDMVESYLADSTEVFYECSVCECANIGESPYCPNCGAKMDGGNEDGQD